MQLHLQTFLVLLDVERDLWSILLTGELFSHVSGCGVWELILEHFICRCITAIESLHDDFVRPLTPEEKEAEKAWVDAMMDFKGLWREGWLMYDGTSYRTRGNKCDYM